MGLTFPNSSRSYDSDHGRIRFVGHDGMFQISFSITTDAVSGKRFDDADAERGYLAAFDANRSQVLAIATKAYARTRKTTYALTAADI
jgi:Protein of unknown function (DUF1488)